MMSNSAHYHGDEVAIIGMSGRFPGSRDINEFWDNICRGVESITFLSEEELLAAGVAPKMLRQPNYVKAAAILQDIAMFDASFFGISPREAELLDPQHRLFLECCWEALEHAGYDPEMYDKEVGVYGGSGEDVYRWRNLAMNSFVMSENTSLQLALGNYKDFLTTRVSYKLNLKGPSVTVQTACSTSLVAVHLACQSLLAGECTLALAGGVSIILPQKQGYLYVEDGVASPDGHCRAFDKRAQGTAGGSGVGVVALKLLEDALSDRDYIHAIIKGSAINNDGSSKVSFSAPSVDQQASVITTALENARVEAKTLTYIETHGSGTPLGDPIEITALTQAFRLDTDARQFCAIGSVKTNVGHLDTAAGITGLIKTVQALKHRFLPPHLHYEQPNPYIDFENSPFYVNTEARFWVSHSDEARRAGVSSFGIGGTNAHVVLEEAPELEHSSSGRPWKLLLFSAKTDTALQKITDNLVIHLSQNTQQPLADIAYTYLVGRKNFPYRRMLVCRDSEDALATLRESDSQRMLTHVAPAEYSSLIFMFPGLGDHYINMARGLYAQEKCFRKQVDFCSEYLIPLLGFDLRTRLYPMGELSGESENRVTSSTNMPALNLRAMLDRRQKKQEYAEKTLYSMEVSQPVLFVIEYALAQLWMSWGIQPDAMIGYSLGEYVAACLAGVFSLEDALTLVVKRARLVQDLPRGAMLAVSLSAEEVQPHLNKTISISAMNGPNLCVVSGPIDDISALERQLLSLSIACKTLNIPHAFHSKLLEPIVEPLTELIKGYTLHAPSIPFVSTATGTWISAEEACDPSYWAKHLCEPIHFAQGVDTLCENASPIFLELGPGRALCSLVQQFQKDRNSDSVTLSTLRSSYEEQPDLFFLLNTLGRLWLQGVQVNWQRFYSDEQRQRLPLPTYPFERQRFWVDPDQIITDPNRDQPFDQNQLGEKKEANVSALYTRPHLLNAYVAPRTDTERRIVEVYQQTLGSEPIGIHDNFFELGGHSLLAAQMITKLREMFQVNIALHTLLEAPTASELAASVTRAQSTKHPLPLVKLQTEGTKKPLFFVHPGGGTVFCYVELARALGNDRPFYAFQEPGIEGEQKPLTRIEELAEHYIKAMKQVQPSGPYLLGAWSMGGAVAFEMALQLQRMHEQVASLALLDTLVPLSENHPLDLDDALSLFWFFKDLTNGKLEIELSEARELDADTALYRYASLAYSTQALSSDIPLTQLKQFFQVFKANLSAYSLYQSQVYKGNVALFIAGEDKEQDPRTAWNQLVQGGLQIHRLPGDHYSILQEPNVRVLAQHLKDYFEQHE